MGRDSRFEDFPGAAGCPVKLGDRFSRKPAAFADSEWFGPVTLVWTVIYINPRHRYYTAEALCHGATLRESSKF